MVEGARLESVYRGNSIEGSNPSLSAIIESITYREVSVYRPILVNRVPWPLGVYRVGMGKFKEIGNSCPGCFSAESLMLQQCWELCSMLTLLATIGHGGKSYTWFINHVIQLSEKRAPVRVKTANC